MNDVSVTTLNDLVESGVVQLTRGKVISKKDIAACPGTFPIYSSAKDNDGKFGEYGKYLFDEELITWSVDGGGRLFHRPKHKFSVTNVGGVLRIRDRSVLNYRYLFYVLSLRHSETSFDWVRKAHPSVIKKLYQNIPVPSLPEQQRIVGILDQAFKAIATAKASTEKNLQNALAIFESHIEWVFSQSGNGWVVCPLAECLELITYGFTNPMPTTEIGPYMITAKNVVDGRIDYDSARHTSLDAFQRLLTDKSRPRTGDVLLTKDGTLGRLAVVERADLCINQSVALLRPNGRMKPLFMKYLLSSPSYQRRMAGDADGATIKHIYITRVDKMDVTFPGSVDEQEKIVGNLDTLTTETRSLVSIYEHKLIALDALKRSLLHQAFAGQL